MSNYKFGPSDAMDFLMEDTPEVEKFNISIGATVEFDSTNSIFPNILKNLGRFDINDLADPDEERTDETPFGRGEEYGTLVEHIPSGIVYAVIPETYIRPVYDYDATTDWPTNIALSIDEPWTPVALDASGTRVGGSTKYIRKAWPHYNGCPLSFAAQYELPNGKYVHIFVNEDADDSWASENGANCAIVDDGPIPSWIELRPVENEDETILFRNAYSAYAPPVLETELPLPPSWIQGDETPEDTGYRFLFQFGDNIPNLDDSEWEFFFGDCGDMYVFYKEETQEARASWQCG